MKTDQGLHAVLLSSLLVACGVSGQDVFPLFFDAGAARAADGESEGEASAGSTGGESGGIEGGGGSGSGSAGGGGRGSSGGNANGNGSSSGGGSGSGAGSGGSSGSGGGAAGSGSGSSGGNSGSGGGSGVCTYGAAFNGTGSFTWYFFGQGTATQNGAFLTACGYAGTEAGMIDTVQNIASTNPASSTYFAAIPGSSGFNTVNQCGACVEITNGAASIIATIIDECPTDNGQNPLCVQAGHLDLSYGAWKALGYSRGNPSGTTYKYVSCPVAGDITARIKSGNGDQVYLQNTVLPIVAATYGGQPANHLSYGVWQLPNAAPAAGATLTLTDVEGHTVTITVPAGGGDTGKQFPNRCP